MYDYKDRLVSINIDMIELDKFADVIDKLKDNGNYRVFNDILRTAGDFPNAIWYSKYSIKCELSCDSRSPDYSRV